MTENAILPTHPVRPVRRFIDENPELVTIFGILLIITAIGAFTSPNFRTEKTLSTCFAKQSPSGWLGWGKPLSSYPAESIYPLEQRLA
jgi:hypothetical protein